MLTLEQKTKQKIYISYNQEMLMWKHTKRIVVYGLSAQHFQSAHSFTILGDICKNTSKKKPSRVLRT